MAVALAAILSLWWFGRRGERWGSTREEFDAALPGDEWLDAPSARRVRMTRAVWVDAPAEQVWPWLAQMGRGAGWYSYDRLDNGGRTSARHIVSWVPAPRLGDAAAIGYLRRIDDGRALAWWLGGAPFFGATMRGVMLFQVTGDGPRARLLTRMQADADGRLAWFACWIYRIVDTIMARRQLLGIKERVERYGARGEDPARPETGARDQYQLYHAILASGEDVGAPGRRDAVPWRRAALEDGVLGPSDP